LERKGKQNKKPLGEFFPQGFLSTGNRALKFLFPLVLKNPLGEFFPQGVLSFHWHQSIGFWVWW